MGGIWPPNEIGLPPVKRIIYSINPILSSLEKIQELVRIGIIYRIDTPGQGLAVGGVGKFLGDGFWITGQTTTFLTFGHIVPVYLKKLKGIF